MDSKRTFGGIGPEYSGPDDSGICLLPVPYDGTSTWGKGSDRGFQAFLEASENMELYDIETDSEVYKRGIYIAPEILERRSPEILYDTVYQRTKELLASGKFLTFLGGEHSVSIGIIDAFREKYRDLTVLQLDAHTDLREAYLGSPYNHACAMHRASKTTNLIQVGIRSMDASEKPFVDPGKCFLARDMALSASWMARSMALMTGHVYISLDLDVLDPSIFPATGTPEPGGMGWYDLLTYLKQVFSGKTVVGFDLVEFAPVPWLRAPDFLVAKLYYKMLSYKFADRHETG